jgi:hypothetical protein
LKSRASKDWSRTSPLVREPFRTSRPLSDASRTCLPVIEIAAYELPPSAANSAMLATIFA